MTILFSKNPYYSQWQIFSLQIFPMLFLRKCVIFGQECSVVKPWLLVKNALSLVKHKKCLTILPPTEIFAFKNFIIGVKRIIENCHSWLIAFLMLKILCLVRPKIYFMFLFHQKYLSVDCENNLLEWRGLDYIHMKLNKHFALFYFCEIRKNDEANSLYLYL